MTAHTAVDNLAKLLLLYDKVDLQRKLIFGVCTIDIAQILRDVLVKDQTAHRRVDDTGNRFVADLFGHAHLDLRMQGDDPLAVGHHGFVHIAEDLSLAFVAVLRDGQIVGAQNHILCRNRHRTAVGRF